MTSQITPPPPDQPIRAVAGAHHRARAARLARRAAQFNKFRLIQLNLVPLVDTFVSVVFFTLVTATVGELAPVVRGVNLPESRVGQPALQQLTLGIGPQLTLGGRPVMSTLDAAQARSDDPAQPLMIPPLYAALRAKADSIRASRATPANQSIDAPLAIQGDRTMRYDLLSRVMQTARLAGFRNLTLQVTRVSDVGVRTS
jgi:biopolymer transport protein ExbD